VLHGAWLLYMRRFDHKVLEELSSTWVIHT
jgi:hypothetical protein